MLQIYQHRLSPNPYFTISRKNLEIGIHNAISIRKIPPEARERTMELVKLILKNDPMKEEVQLVSVKCSECDHGFAAPKIAKIKGVAEDKARALYEQQRALKTKTYGIFRFVDHFGISVRQEENRNTQSSRGLFGSMWYLIFFLGFRTIIMVLFLYYILGFEMKIGKRWIPLGPILLILGFLGVIYIVLNLRF